MSKGEREVAGTSEVSLETERSASQEVLHKIKNFVKTKCHPASSTWLHAWLLSCSTLLSSKRCVWRIIFPVVLQESLVPYLKRELSFYMEMTREHCTSIEISLRREAFARVFVGLSFISLLLDLVQREVAQVWKEGERDLSSEHADLVRCC